MIRRPPRSTLDRSSAASDVYKRQNLDSLILGAGDTIRIPSGIAPNGTLKIYDLRAGGTGLSLIHISEPTRPY